MKQLVERDGIYTRVEPDGAGWQVVTAFLGNVVGNRLAIGDTSAPAGQPYGIPARDEADKLCAEWDEDLRKVATKQKRKKR